MEDHETDEDLADADEVDIEKQGNHFANADDDSNDGDNADGDGNDDVEDTDDEESVGTQGVVTEEGTCDPDESPNDLQKQNMLLCYRRPVMFSSKQ